MGCTHIPLSMFLWKLNLKWELVQLEPGPFLFSYFFNPSSFIISWINMYLHRLGLKENKAQKHRCAPTFNIVLCPRENKVGARSNRAWAMWHFFIGLLRTFSPCLRAIQPGWVGKNARPRATWCAPASNIFDVPDGVGSSFDSSLAYIMDFCSSF
jgi:hypothetical protein